MRTFWFRWKEYLLAGALFCLAVWGAFFIVRASEIHGMGIRTDSVAYIWAARNLADGNGLGRPDGLGNFKPFTHWPPPLSCTPGWV